MATVFDPTNAATMNELVDSLIDLAAVGLRKLYDPGMGLFHLKARKTEDNRVEIIGHSIRYTLICLLGLGKMKASGRRCPLEADVITKALLRDTSKVTNIGDLGLLVWLASMVCPGEVEDLIAERSLIDVMSTYIDGNEGKTTELAWCLTGLSYAALATGLKSIPVVDVADKAYRAVIGNYGGKGIFGHCKTSSLKGFIRGRIGCFADQVYPIYALSRYFRVFGEQKALIIARECAEAICSKQGEFGQWWWLYDSKKGEVVGRYPVYSVHQDGMAPMALLELGRMTSADHSNSIDKGLAWLMEQNELNQKMVDGANSVIWRSIYYSKSDKYKEIFTSMVLSRPCYKPHGELKVLYECWSYHLGWLLYAFSGQGGRSAN